MTKKDGAVISRQDFVPKNTLSKRGRLFGQTQRAWYFGKSTSTIFVVYTRPKRKPGYNGIAVHNKEIGKKQRNSANSVKQAQKKRGARKAKQV